jgi:hypothetical protein
VVGLVVALAVVAGASAVPGATGRVGAVSSGSGPFLTLLFSRTAVTAANDCAEDDTGVARLDTVVAPTLYGLGLRPTGTIETAPTRQSSLWCGHFRQTLYASWSLAGRLAASYGWTFGSHSASYPDSEAAWSALPPGGLDAQTCSSDRKLAANGLPGSAGLFAWPNNYVYAPALPDVERCFDFNRANGSTWVVDQTTATQPPYPAPTRALDGGHCIDRAAPCFSYSFAHARARYTPPAAISSMLSSLEPDQWTTVQVYLLVTGARPGQWDCTDPDPREHWTDDTERYCWNDYLAIVSSIPPGVTVTDPASIAAAWGRAPAR